MSNPLVNNPQEFLAALNVLLDAIDQSSVADIKAEVKKCFPSGHTDFGEWFDMDNVINALVRAKDLRYGILSMSQRANISRTGVKPRDTREQKPIANSVREAHRKIAHGEEKLSVAELEIQIRDFADKNYNSETTRWDIVVEAMTTPELIKVIGNPMTFNTAKMKVRKHINNARVRGE